MRSFWFDPYLWVHLAGLAALPIFLELCLVGFAIGDPILPVWLELGLVALLGLAPVLWMQWQRPFYIFSLVAIALKPEQLTDDQRRLLTLFKAPRNRILAVGVAIALLVILQQMYGAAAIAAQVVPWAGAGRGVGLLLASLGFLASHLFLQVPVSVSSVMLTSEAEFSATTPYPTDQIRAGFTRLGLPVNQILPPIALPPQPAMSVPNAASASLASLATDLEEPAIEPERSSSVTPSIASPTELPGELPAESDFIPPDPETSAIPAIDSVDSSADPSIGKASLTEPSPNTTSTPTKDDEDWV